MAKKANTAKAVQKKQEAVSVPAEFSSLTEEQLRDRARADMQAMQRGEEIETVSVTMARTSAIAELGGKVLVGSEHDLPVSVIAFYDRTQRGLFEETGITNEEGKAPEAPAGEQADGKVTNEHSPDGTIQN